MKFLLSLGLLFCFSASANVTGPQIPSQAGQSGKFLTTNGSILSWGAGGGGGGTPGGANTAVQYNSSGSFAGDTANFNYIVGTQTLSVTNASIGTVISTSVAPAVGQNLSLATANNGAGNSGSVSLSVGSASGTQGNIQFIKTGLPSVAGQCWMATDTAGNGYWDTCGGGGGGTSPGGASTAIQFNNSGAFGGDASQFSYVPGQKSVYIGAQAPGGNFLQTWALVIQSAIPMAFVSGYTSGDSGVLFQIQNPSASFSNLQGVDGVGGVKGLSFQSSGGDVVMGTGGNVGIGTNAPAVQLHTTGAVRFANFGAGVATFDAGGNISSTGGIFGTICGWYDVGTTTLIANCNGSNPSVSCPAGFTQRITSIVDFCSAN